MFKSSKSKKTNLLTLSSHQVRQRTMQTQRKKTQSPLFGDCYCGLIMKQCNQEEKRLKLYTQKINHHKQLNTYTQETPSQVQREIDKELPHIKPCSLCHLKD